MKTNPYFPEIHGLLGFGAMRLPMQGKEIDLETTKKMVDRFIESGFNYFDTAHGYHSEKSETALRACLTSCYPRESYILTDKLTRDYFETEEDIRPFFEKQLKLCGVDYFDFYLMHAQGRGNYDHFRKCRAYETAFELKKEGKIRHVGLSFHDTADVLEQILKDYPQVDVVQIQYNYLDYENLGVQSRKLRDVCRKYDKPILVMEPVKGGQLAKLPEQALEPFKKLGDASPASYAMRFAAGAEGVCCVLSGMSSMEQMEDNIRTMLDPQPLSGPETEAAEETTRIMHSLKLIDCTSCHYCTDGCPVGIRIPEIFSCRNTQETMEDWDGVFAYNNFFTGPGTKASDCIACGQCEEACPQHLPVTRLLAQIAEEYEK